MLAIGFAIFTTLTISADPTDVVIKVTKKKGSNPIGDRNHAPMRLPVEVTFDDATGVLTVQAPEELEGCVFVYNINGTTEASSDHLNATFTLTSPGIHIVSIQGEDWIGEGRFIL